MNYSKQSLQFQIGQIGDSEKRILKYGKQLTSFELCPHTRFAGQKNNLYNGKG